MSRRRIGALISLLALVAIARLTLLPQGGGAPRSAVPWWCLLCADLAALGMLLNVALFAPLGIGLRLAGASVGRAALAGAGLSLLVELLQYRTIHGRDASIDDLVANVLGASLGALLVSVAPRAASIAGRRPLAVTVAGTAVWCALLVVSGELSKPSTPAGGVFVRTSPGDGGASFSGEVLEARLDGRVRRAGERIPPRAGRPRARRLEARVVAGEGGASRATIAVAVDERQHEFLELERQENDLLARARLRSGDAGLLSPTIRLRDAFEGWPTDTLVVSARYSLDGLDASICAASACRTRRLARTPGWGWRFVVPGAERVDRWPSLLNAVWIALLVAPVGAMLGRARAPSGRALALGVIVLGLVTALAAAPLWRVGRLAPPAEWLAAIGGLGAGLLARRAWRGRTSRKVVAPQREPGADDAGALPVHSSH